MDKNLYDKTKRRYDKTSGWAVWGAGNICGGLGQQPYPQDNPPVKAITCPPHGGQAR